MGITPDDINSIDDIVKLPFTTKHDLRDNYPFGLCAVPMSQIVRIHASSGTTGKPTVVGYTRKDLSTWAECISRAFTAYGAGRSDVFQVSYILCSAPLHASALPLHSATFPPHYTALLLRSSVFGKNRQIHVK